MNVVVMHVQDTRAFKVSFTNTSEELRIGSLSVWKCWSTQIFTAETPNLLFTNNH